MKSSSTRVPVLNSLVFIRDPTIEELPKIDGLSAVWVTTSCVAVSCLPDSEGETNIAIGPAQEIGLSGKPLFDGWLKTPSRALVVETVLKEAIVETRVPNLNTRVRIWTNGHRATDFVIIGLE